ncbi:hypothetical protein NEUTE2DRAFT_122944 [Neurospora tetrasperma FGSC 2509]|nr:hypothetical protein NEUTE2DRAFT_122944 [Neurospora tetrasperma FGSC 2509]
MRRSSVRRWRSRRRSRLSSVAKRERVGEVVALSGRLKLKLKPQRRDAVTVAVWTVRSDRREVKREDEEKRPAPLDAKRGYRQCSTFPLEAKNEANLGPRNLGRRRKKIKMGKDRICASLVWDGKGQQASN